MSPATGIGGYLFVVLHRNGKKFCRRINRIVAETFLPNPESKPEVDHVDTNKFNNHVSNLRWATGAENQQYALESGKRKTGTAHPAAKLSATAVEYVRLNPDALTINELAAKFGVCRTTIKDVRRGRKYPKEKKNA